MPAGVLALELPQPRPDQPCLGPQAEDGAIFGGGQTVGPPGMVPDVAVPVAACVTLDLVALRDQHAEFAIHRAVPLAEAGRTMTWPIPSATEAAPTVPAAVAGVVVADHV